MSELLSPLSKDSLNLILERPFHFLSMREVQVQSVRDLHHSWTRSFHRCYRGQMRAAPPFNIPFQSYILDIVKRGVMGCSRTSEAV